MKTLTTAPITASHTNGHSPQSIDYDLHGLAGIRLINPSASDAAAVVRQLGPIQKPLSREPDIIIRFVDRLPSTSPVRYLGLNDAGFTDDAFLVLRSKYGAHAKVQIAFEQIGKQCEIVCETGLPAVPLLIPILNLTVLSQGAIPLHASAFTYNGTGVLTTGWSKGGKTETLLSFMSRGAEYIGDEWVYISRDGQHIYGIPEPIRVWEWHLQELPQYRLLLGRGDRTRLRALQFLAQLADRAVSSAALRRGALARVLHRLLPIVKRQLFVDMRPQKLFGQRSCTLAGTLQKVLFVASHETSDITVQQIDPQEIADRMIFSLQYERQNFMSYYLKFRFAFPEIRNEFIEQAEQLQREILTRVLADKQAYAVYHPYPVSLPALFDAINPLCR
jgi:hypothetical protein